MAAAIHNEKASGRQDLSFPSTCGALPEETHRKPKLFGHVKGAFTGAVRGQERPFSRLADKGDGPFSTKWPSCPRECRWKLPAVSSRKKTFEKGRRRKKPSRWMSASSARPTRTLEKEVKKETFREDLFFPTQTSFPSNFRPCGIEEATFLC